MPLFAGTRVAGAGVGAGDHAEQLAFRQGFRDRAAVDRHQRATAAGAFVDAARQRIFAGAGFAFQQHIHIQRGDSLTQFMQMRMNICRRKGAPRERRRIQRGQISMAGAPALLRRAARAGGNRFNHNVSSNSTRIFAARSYTLMWQ